MKLIHRDEGGVAVVEVRGKLLGGVADSATFRSFFQSLVDDGKRRFVVDLRDTPWVNSLGIGMLIVAYASVKKAGGELVFTNATVRIEHVLEVTRLSLVLRDFPTLDEAIAHLTSGPAVGRRAESLPADGINVLAGQLLDNPQVELR